MQRLRAASGDRQAHEARPATGLASSPGASAATTQAAAHAPLAPYSPVALHAPLRIVFALLLAIACALGPSSAAAEPPDDGECPSISALPSQEVGGVDSAALVLTEGMAIDEEGLLLLRTLLPPELWQHREVFFFEGMRLLLGRCHRRFPVPESYQATTRRFAGEPEIDKKGNLRHYTAGLPFPQAQISADDPQAGIKWAWNFAKRYRGPGHKGSMRITSIPGRVGGVHRYRGSFFIFNASQRSDLAQSGYKSLAAKDELWAAGGEFSAPYSTRELAWRQFRPKKSETKWRQPDSIFVYVPTMRKVRRAATNWVDGAYVPNFKVAGQYGGGGLAMGQGGSINPTSGAAIASTEDARSGLTGLFLRPNAYEWRLHGEKAVIAPLNGYFAGYPLDPERNYGTSGLSPANDRWDVRQAVVIEGALREENETIRTLTVYLDYQTLQPLYWITRTTKRRLVDVGVLVHRFTGDVENYPRLPDGSSTSIFEPVAATFYDALSGQGGWLRESYDLLSLPFDEAEQRRMLTTDTLQRGH